MESSGIQNSSLRSALFWVQRLGFPFSTAVLSELMQVGAPESVGYRWGQCRLNGATEWMVLITPYKA